MNEKLERLVVLLENNPNAEIKIDNDCWDIINPEAFDENGDEIEGIEPYIAVSADYTFKTE